MSEIRDTFEEDVKSYMEQYNCNRKEAEQAVLRFYDDVMSDATH